MPAVWDDPAVDWDAFTAVVIRSTWDYAARRDAFLAWAGSVPRLINPAPVLRWNTDKRYLAELAAAGIAVVPTAFAAPGEALELPDAPEIVVKPAVSAGAKDTARYGSVQSRRAFEHVAALHAAERVAMVQPYLDAVDAAGETALVFFGGVFSHAIRKGPLLPASGAMADGLFAEEDISPRDPSAAERDAADAVMAVVHECFGALAYARVDLLRGPGDEPLLLELELTEPSLFLEHDAAAPDRLADAIVAVL